MVVARTLSLAMADWKDRPDLGGSHSARTGFLSPKTSCPFVQYQRLFLLRRQQLVPSLGLRIRGVLDLEAYRGKFMRLVTS
jgi:hypothetical protein